MAGHGRENAFSTNPGRALIRAAVFGATPDERSYEVATDYTFFTNFSATPFMQ